MFLNVNTVEVNTPCKRTNVQDQLGNYNSKRLSVDRRSKLIEVKSSNATIEDGINNGCERKDEQ